MAVESDSAVLREPSGGDESDSVGDFIEVYPKASPVRLRAIIFCRGGWDADCAALKDTLEQLRFSVEVKQELTLDVLQQERENVFYASTDCLLVAVLAHEGEESSAFAGSGSSLKSKLWSEFMADKWPALAGKPKIFILQVCKGSYKLIETDAAPTMFTMAEPQMSIPAEADLLVMSLNSHSGCSDHITDLKTGSYIHVLCEELKKNWKEEDLLTMLTHASDKIISSSNRNELVPSITSTLRRKIHL